MFFIFEIQFVIIIISIQRENALNLNKVYICLVFLKSAPCILKIGQFHSIFKNPILFKITLFCTLCSLTPLASVGHQGCRAVHFAHIYFAYFHFLICSLCTQYLFFFFFDACATTVWLTWYVNCSWHLKYQCGIIPPFMTHVCTRQTIM